MISEGWQISVKITHPHRFCMKPELTYYGLALKEKTGKNLILLYFSLPVLQLHCLSPKDPSVSLRDHTHTHTRIVPLEKQIFSK